uniref:Uncharacterized protein n=1 Tax=Candidatus Methanophaga sp. ANME-1 ERB7 TaxID=2759913 RepID=A0A7G9Z666_9EURY|nr:hypothetical protein BDFDLMKG_00020 [Methanosarcinales archaeon ANME-1 ERB7]
MQSLGSCAGGGTFTVIVPILRPPFESMVICPVCVPGDKSCVSIVTVTTSTSLVVESLAGFTLTMSHLIKCQQTIYRVFFL